MGGRCQGGGELRIVSLRPRQDCRQKSLATIMKTKVFEVDIRLWVQLPSGLNERIDKVVISLAPDSLLSEAEVELIIQQLLVVRPAVKDHR